MSKIEIWKDIQGFEGFYQVSNMGNVRSLARIIYRKTSTMHRKGMNLVKTPDKDGYLLVGLKVNGKEKKAKVHRLVADAFIENKDNLPMVNHKDGVKTNNNVYNLEWVTAKENSIHARNNNLLNPSKGEKNGKHKLTEKDVIEIRKLIKEGKSLNSIAKLYNVKQPSIKNIKTGKNWKWLEG